MDFDDEGFKKAVESASRYHEKYKSWFKNYIFKDSDFIIYNKIKDAFYSISEDKCKFEEDGSYCFSVSCLIGSERINVNVSPSMEYPGNFQLVSQYGSSLVVGENTSDLKKDLKMLICGLVEREEATLKDLMD